MIHAGYCLKIAIASGDVTAQQVSDALQIGRTGIYSMYGKEQFDKSELDALRKKGLKIAGVTVEGSPHINTSPTEAACLQEVQYLKELLRSKEETIEVLRQALAR